MVRRRISDAAERTLEAWLDQVTKGQLHIAELPLCVSAWFFAGYADGRASRQHEIDRLEHQLDGLWARAFLKPDERRERILRRLDQGLTNATEEQWQQIEHDLAAIMRSRQAEVIGAGPEPAERRQECQQTTKDSGPHAPSSRQSSSGHRRAA
ncbi:hypothetical protein AB3K78_15420 [Leucobacter sp. HNU]|uniref:hypothetical protein n=1 Tax=Leucobacter sp. HNU TaxID=3236805 RepID=UPI003A810E16